MTRTLLTGRFWADATERAVKTLAQTALATWFVNSALDKISISSSDSVWIVAGAGVFSILTSIVSAPFGEQGTASVLSAD